MSTVSVLTPPAAPPTPPLTPALSAPLVVVGEVGPFLIPPGIKDLDSFRRWATQDDDRERRRFSFLEGTVWVDLAMEQLYTHGRLKGEVFGVLQLLTKTADTGFFLPDGTRLSSPRANLSTVPDGIFTTYEALDARRVREVPGARAGFVELEGGPDMVLEILSDSSVVKDMEVLPRGYWVAGILEFWRIDARGEVLRFEIFSRGSEAFVPELESDGWQRSEVFGKWFSLRQDLDRRGQPKYTLDVRD